MLINKLNAAYCRLCMYLLVAPYVRSAFFSSFLLMFLRLWFLSMVSWISFIFWHESLLPGALKHCAWDPALQSIHSITSWNRVFKHHYSTLPATKGNWLNWSKHWQPLGYRLQIFTRLHVLIQPPDNYGWQWRVLRVFIPQVAFLPPMTYIVDSFSFPQGHIAWLWGQINLFWKLMSC